MYGMRINPIITKHGCNSLKMIPNIVLNNIHFKQGGLVLTYTHKVLPDNKDKLCRSHIILAYIIIERVKTAFFALLLNKVHYAIIVDLMIQHSAGRVLVMSSDILIQHYFAFTQNNSTVQFFTQSKVIIENNTKVINYYRKF